MKHVLFLNGIPDDRLVKVDHIKKMTNIVYVAGGSANIYPFLSDIPFKKSMAVIDTSPKQEFEVVKPHAFFNQIADADSHRIALHKTAQLLINFPDIPLFNHPKDVLKTTRDNTYRLLHDIEGLVVPKTVSISPSSPQEIHDMVASEEIGYPFIFRGAGSHGGENTTLVTSENEMFYAYALDGKKPYYITQYVDYADSDGIYTKYRFAIVDGDVFIRHVIFKDHWMIHSRSREFMQKEKYYLQKEADLLKTFETTLKPQIAPLMETIAKRVGLDYFGMDCHIDTQGNILLFELNANMNILYNNAKDPDNIWNRQITLIVKAIEDMITRRI